MNQSNRPTLLLFLLLAVNVFWLEAQNPIPISGVINNYYPVTEIFNKNAPDVDSVRVTDNTGLLVGGYAIIMQMQSADSSLDAGGILNSYAGKYEIMRISALINSDLVVFTSTLSGYPDEDNLNRKISFALPGKIQLISLPRYSDAIVSSLLTCKAWDGESGGVLALMVDDSLILNADIDVSGKGYRGAIPTLWDDCIQDPASPLDGLSPNSDSVGVKGESIVYHGNDSVFYRGINDHTIISSDGLASSAGGGPGVNAGGGGGGNAGAGGDGAAGLCLGDLQAFGATSFIYSNSDSTQNRIFMGGGGGGGTHSTGLSSSNGGNGGGIVFIITRKLLGGGHQILSNGSSVLNCTGGAGGGGAGGAILLNVLNYFGPVILQAAGSKGGDGKSGGGGGGGGKVWYAPPVAGNFGSPVVNAGMPEFQAMEV
jgi:hypothetical protein